MASGSLLRNASLRIGRNPEATVHLAPQRVLPRADRARRPTISNNRRLERALWGGPPGPRGTPWSRSVKFLIASQKADQGVGRGPGGPPHNSKNVKLFLRGPLAFCCWLLAVNSR